MKNQKFLHSTRRYTYLMKIVSMVLAVAIATSVIVFADGGYVFSDEPDTEYVTDGYEGPVTFGASIGNSNTLGTSGILLTLEQFDRAMDFAPTLVEESDLSGTRQYIQLAFATNAGWVTETDLQIPKNMLQVMLTVPEMAEILSTNNSMIEIGTAVVDMENGTKTFPVTWVEDLHLAEGTAFSAEIHFRTTKDGITGHGESFEIGYQVFFDGEESRNENNSGSKTFTAKAPFFKWGTVQTQIQLQENSVVHTYTNNNNNAPWSIAPDEDGDAFLPTIALHFTDTTTYESNSSREPVGNVYAKEALVVETYKVSQRDGIPDILFTESDITPPTDGEIVVTDTEPLDGTEYVLEFRAEIPVKNSDPSSGDLNFTTEPFTIENAVVNPDIIPSTSGKTETVSIKGNGSTNSSSVTPAYAVDGIDTSKTVANAASAITFTVLSTEDDWNPAHAVVLGKHISGYNDVTNSSTTGITGQVTVWSGDRVTFTFSGINSLYGKPMEVFRTGC